MPVRIVKLGTARAADEGTRIGTVRRPPRGVPKSEFATGNWYDVWYPNLAPSEERIDGLEFLTFGGGGDSVGTAVATSTSPNTAVAVGKSAHRYCEATFVLKDDIIQCVNYQGRTGGLLTKGEQCAFIVENCVRQ